MSSILGKLPSALSFATMITKLSLSIMTILGPLVCGVGADFPCKTKQIHWKTNSTLGKRYKCLDCPDCPEGTQPSVPCGSSVPYNTPVDCVPCQLSKTYSNRYDKAQCQPCTVCSPGKVVIKNCTLSSNTECDDKCAHGYYSVPFVFTCLPCTECCNDEKDEFAKECKNYGKKCKVPSTPCRRMNTTPSSTHSEMLKSEAATMLSSKLVKQTSSVTLPLSDKNRQVDGRSRASEEDNGQTKMLMIVAIVSAIIGILAVLALIAFIVCGGRITNDCFRKRKSNSFDEVEAPTALTAPAPAPASAPAPAAAITTSSEQLSPEGVTLEWLEEYHLDVFEQVCLMLDNGRWRCSRYYERLASKYRIIRLEVRNTLRDELQIEGGSPSRLLMKHLKVSYPNLPVRHLIQSLKEIGRNDIAQLLMQYLRQNVSAIPASNP